MKFSGSSSSALPVDVSEGLSEELESLVHASDLLYASPDDLTRMIGILPWWDEVWSAQQLDGAAEVYACCCPAADLNDGRMATSSATGGSAVADEEVDVLGLVADLAQALPDELQLGLAWPQYGPSSDPS